MKKVAILLSLIVFCFAQNNTSTKTNISGQWNVSALKGTYDRKVVTGSGIEHSADSYNLVASWDDAAGFAAATGGDPAVITGVTNQTLDTWAAGDNAPGFPLTNVLDAASLAALGIGIQSVFDDAPSNDKTGTYKIMGTYPSLRLNSETCTPYFTISQINDSGDYTLTLDATGTAGTMAFAPATDLEQVLPPFPDGKFTVDGNAGKMTIDFLDRDNSSSRYSEVMAAWSEADDRVISGISQLPVNTAGGFFTTLDDPAAGDLASSAYIAHSLLAAWDGYLTWYAFNVAAETSVKVADVKNPLTDLDGDGSITLTDMIVYMHVDNLAGGGSVSVFGIPYTMLVDSSNPTAPAAVNDSATDFALAGIGTFSGGKMKFTINGLCMPVDETIDIAFEFSIINSEPEISTTQDLTINEDESSTVTLSATDADGDAITYSAVSDTNAVTISVSSTTLTLTPNANWHGIANIKAYASDGYSNDSTSFTLTVTPVQDTPTAFEWVSTASTSIDITKTNLTDTYELKWSESKDVDIDTIDYLISASVGQFPAEMINETADTSMTITYQDIIDNWYPNLEMLSRGTLKFSVSATDGIDTVNVTGDDRVLFVNRYEYLSTEGEGVPVEFALHENYPNPFNPTTTLRFDLPEVSDITLTIYNMLGQKVRTFDYQNTSAGYHSVTWNATNDYGDPVGAGVYLYQLQTKDFVKTRKMVLLK